MTANPTWAEWDRYRAALRYPMGSREADVLLAVDRVLSLLRAAAPDLPPPQAGPGGFGLDESMELAWGGDDGRRLYIEVDWFSAEYSYREGGEQLRGGRWYLDRPIWPELAWAAREIAGGGG